MPRHSFLPGRAAPPERPARPALPVQTARGNPPAADLERFNSAPADVVRTALTGCLRSPRWAHRIVAHRPYPDLDALLAAADEAAYDLSPGEIAEALAGEPLPSLPDGAYVAAHTALRAAHTAYRDRFGHVFVICADGVAPDEVADLLLEGISARLRNEPEDERVLVAEELRRLARGRLVRLVRDCGPRPEAQQPPAPQPEGAHGRYPERMMSGRTTAAGPGGAPGSGGTCRSAAAERALPGARPAGGVSAEVRGAPEPGKAPESAQSAVSTEWTESADCREAAGSGTAIACPDSPYVPV